METMENEDSGQKSCTVCGEPISSDSEEKYCLACFLKLAASETENGATEVWSPETNGIPNLEELSAAFPGLELLELVGRGGMGTVIKAKQKSLNRLVALKILHTKLSQKEHFAERFLREARILARLNHPNIVSVHDFGESNGMYYLIMEFVEGLNLRQLMRREHLSPELAIEIIPEICEALQYAHGEGILHRDIKPENILLDTKGHVKIADFGIGKLLRAEAERNSRNLTRTGTVLGTPDYMAPEQFESPDHVDHRADIYSLGVVFYEMLTGEVPRGSFPMPSEKTPIGRELDDIVVKALKRNPEQRHQSAKELKTEIETAAEHISESEHEPEAEIFSNDFPEKYNRSLGKYAFVVLLIGILFLLVGPLIFTSARKSDARLLREISLSRVRYRILEEEYKKTSLMVSNIADPSSVALGEDIRKNRLHSIKEAMKNTENESRLLSRDLEALLNDRSFGWYFVNFTALWCSIPTLFLGWCIACVHLNRLGKFREKPGLIPGSITLLASSMLLVSGLFWLMINMAEGVGI